MSKRYCFIMLVLTCGICKGQNLVPNPSFEVHDTCPDNLNQVHRATDWFAANGTPDYFNSCFSGTGWNMGVPINWCGHQSAYDGNGYMGMATFFEPDSSLIGIREAIGIYLTTPLISGTKYFATLHVSLVENNGAAANKIGIMFSNTEYITMVPLNNQSKVFTDSIISDTLNWVKVSGSFVADSNYSYLYVGNFFQDSLVNFNPFSTVGGRAHYYVDDICVSTDSLTCELSVGVPSPKQTEEIALFPNPFGNSLNIPVQEASSLVLYDVTSKEVLRQTFSGSTTINTEQLSRGMYFYELRNNEGIIRKGKVVKQ